MLPAFLLDILAGSPNAGRPSPWANVTGNESGNELFGKIVSSASQPEKPVSTTAQDVEEADAAEDYGRQRRMAALAEKVGTGKANEELAGQGRKSKLYEGLQGLDQENPDFVKMATELGLKYGENPEKYAASLSETQQRSKDREAEIDARNLKAEADRVADAQNLQERLKANSDMQKERMSAEERRQKERLEDKAEGRQQFIDLKRDLAKSSQGKNDLNIGRKESQWTEDQWQKFAKYTNGLNASSRSALGMSGIANVRAGRAMDLLTDPGITTDPKMFEQVQTDIDGIMKGAAPTDIQYKDHYNTLKGKLAQVWGYVQSKPAAVNQPEIKQQLVNIIKGLQLIDNKVIDKNLGVGKVAFKKIITNDPERAQELFDAIEGSKDVFPPENRQNLSGAEADAPAGSSESKTVMINGQAVTYVKGSDGKWHKQ
jgi:hypothetical protein